MNAKREQWSSTIVFILATTGAAVGLGNIWKFPYMVGANGGSAFVLLYFICVTLIAVPVMVAELIMGRRAQSDPVTTFQTLALESKGSRHWDLIGWWGALTLILLFSFYSVVASWGMAYLYFALKGSFIAASPQAIHGVWQAFLASPLQMLFWDTIFVVLTTSIVAKGVTQGLEKASLVMMPALLLLLAILACYSMMVGEPLQTYHYLFDFNLHKVTPAVVIAAMGHAFFSLAVGACCILTYGSYLPRTKGWGATISYIVVLDVIVAILSGLAIFPLVFMHHLSPQAGPGLMFEVLPIAFSQMSYGTLVGACFFILLIFAALSSSISFAEPLVALLTERYSLGRHKATYLIGVVAWVLSLGSLLSFNLWHDNRLFNRWNFFAGITDLATNVLLPIGGLLLAFFAAWILPKASSREEFQYERGFLHPVWYFLTRYIAPLGIIVILLSPLF